MVTEEYLCGECGMDRRVNGLGECEVCGADLRTANAMNFPEEESSNISNTHTQQEIKHGKP